MEYKINDFKSLLSWVERNPVDASLQIQQMNGKITAFEQIIGDLSKLSSEKESGK